MTRKQRITRTLIVLAALALMCYLGVKNSPDMQDHPDNVNPNDSVRHPDNQPFVLECAFNLGVDIESVTQLQFNKRYLS